jgi:L-fuconolactonase
MRIDAHHHLWRYTSKEFGWITDDMALLRRGFLPPELEQQMASAGVDATVVVQARQTVDETEWLLQQAAASDAIAGVVGWGPIADADFEKSIEPLLSHRKLVGLRHILQSEPAGFLGGEDFNRGIRYLTANRLTYDVLVYSAQLNEVIEFVDRHPNQRFVIDHCAKPQIKNAELEPWKRQMMELARRSNVWCKVSGLVTEASWQVWSLEILRPYLDTVLEAFGTERCMAGSDWPVLLVAATYKKWWSVLEQYTSGFKSEECSAFFGGTARSFYGLKVGVPRAVR